MNIIIHLLRNGELIKLPLTGNCMYPLLKQDDIVIIEPRLLSQITRGDVVLFLCGDNFIAHRFIKTKTINSQKNIITKSDRGYCFDNPIPVSCLLGKITQVIKGSKVIYYESMKWRSINFTLGILSPYISKFEYLFMSVIRFLRKCGSNIFKMVFGISFSAYSQRFKKKLNIE